MNLVPLASVADVQLGKMLSPKSKTGSNSFRYLRNTNVQWGRLDLSDLAEMDFSDAERRKFELRYGDLLVCEGGEPGRCTVWRSELSDCYYQKALHRVRPHDGKADSLFLSFWMRYQASTGAFADQNAKTTIAHLPQVRLEQLLVPDVEIDVQSRISSRLTAQLAEVNAALEAALAQGQEFDALRAAVYREAFSQVVPIAVPPIADESPSGWQWRKLCEIARLESGHTPSRNRPDWWGGDVSWMSLTEIRAFDGQWVEQTQLRTNELGIANSSARVLPQGTVCLSRTASVGFVAIMAKPMSTSQDFANWVCGDELDPEFLMHALIASRRQLREMATGATHKTIYMPALEDFHLCAPGIDEQRRIASRLKAQLAEVEVAKKAAELQLQEIRSMPQRLLAQAFGNTPS